MTVKSVDMRDGEVVERGRVQAIRKPRKASALFKREGIEHGRTLFERIVGLALLGGSAAGNYLAFNAGAFTPFNVIALAAAVIALFLLTALQWFYRPEKLEEEDAWWFMRVAYWFMGLNWKYCAAVLIGVGLTVWGAKTIILPVFQKVLVAWVDAELVLPLAWLLLCVVSLIIEVIPENILVD